MARRHDPRRPHVVMWMRRRGRDRVLELDGASGRHHRGREQRRDVRGSGAHRADADDGRSAGPALRRPRRARRRRRRCRRRRPRARWRARRAARASARSRANRRLTPRSWWRNSRQPAQSRMWRRAVAFGRSPRSCETISSSRISEHAVSRASSACPSASRARTSSDLTAGTVTPSAPGHVGVGHSAELAHQQRRPLLLGEPADVRDQAPERLAPVGLVDRVVHRGAQQLEHLGRRRRRPAQLVDAAVVRDAVQPGPERELAVVGPQARVGAHEDVLERVLGVLAVR